MESCDICIEPFNRSSRKCIECFNCQKKACSTCIQRYILDSSTEAKCLHCNIQWDRRFMIQNLTQKFCNTTYRKHRAELLYEQKKYLLPRISNILSYENALEKLRKEEQEILSTYRRKVREIRDTEHHIYSLKDAFYANREENSVEEKFSNRQAQNRPCITEGCLGYIDGKGNCPVCHKVTCLSCNIDKTEQENHECREEDKLQWIEIRNSTKPCPSCRVRIFKISGCDQMWCVQCNTAFSWSRGTIERGAVHNPHYFDWLFEGGQQPQQVRHDLDYCNDTELPPEVNFSQRMFEEYKATYKEEHNIISTETNGHVDTRTRPFTMSSQLWYDFKKYSKKRILFDIYRIIRHIQLVEIPQLQQNEYNYRRGLYDYLVSILNNKDCRKQIEQYDYKRQCNYEMAEILSAFIRQCIYVFNAYMRTEEMKLSDLIRELDQFASMYVKGIETFEKEYKRSYKKQARHVLDIQIKIQKTLSNHS